MGGKAHILVLQYHADARATIMDILTSEGFLVTASASTPETLEHLRGQKFDLVVTGLRMGEVKGADVVKKIREVLPDPPVVIVTSHPEEKVRQAALDAGGSEVVLKPFRIEQFLWAVRGALAGVEERNMKG